MLYKVRLTAQELESQSVDQIRQIAQRPRALIQRVDHELSEQARAFYLRHRAKVEEELSKRPAVFTQVEYKGEAPPCIRTILEKGVDEGLRNEALFRLAVFLARGGEGPEEIKAQLLAWNQRNRPPLDKLDEIERTVLSAYQGAMTDLYSVGCRTQILHDHCSTAGCPFFDESKPQPLTPDIKEFLKSPDLHKNTVRILGHRIVGEDSLKALLFYNGIGAVVHETPSGAIVCDRYGLGKSYVERMVAGVFPKSRVEQPTSITEEAVNYLAESYKGRMVRIDELHGMEKGLPRIRSWMTEGRIEHWIAPSSEDKVKKTRKIIGEGCPVFMTSTTQTPEPQFARRNWILFCDPTVEQTKRIHDYQDERWKFPKVYFKPQEDELGLLSKAVCFIMDNARQVKVPYKYSFPSEDPRSRGDKERFSQLIANMANWHALQRRRLKTSDGEEYIIADEQDLNIAFEVVTPFLKTTLTGLDKASLQILEHMQKKQKEDPTIVFTVKIIWDGVRKEDRSRFCEQHIRNRLDLLEEANLVSIDTDTKPYKIILLMNQPASLEGLVKITDDGSATLEEYRKMGEIIEPEEREGPEHQEEIERAEKHDHGDIKDNQTPKEPSTKQGAEGSEEFQDTQTPLEGPCFVCSKPASRTHLTETGGLIYLHEECEEDYGGRL